MREKIEKFIGVWEQKSKASMHLDSLLAKPIKAKLIDGLMEIIEAEMDAAPMLETEAGLSISRTGSPRSPADRPNGSKRPKSSTGIGLGPMRTTTRRRSASLIETSFRAVFGRT